MLQCWLRTLTPLVLGLSVAWGQTYPRWFLNPVELGCERVIVGFASPSYYTDSAISRAVKNARENFARQQSSRIEGGQLFWATEAGTYWMGADFTEQYDTAASETALTLLAPVDSLATKNVTLCLLIDQGCQPDRRFLQRVAIRPEAPSWTETLPEDSKYLYAVGLSTEYYYEVSSWLEAERMGRRSLARSVVVALASLQRVNDHEGHDLRREQVSVSLSNIEVVARWRDFQKKIVYVLLRAPKEGNMR